MQPETALLFWWLHCLNKKRYDALVERCGTLDAALGELSPALLKAIGLKQDSIEKLFARLEEFDAERSLPRFRDAGIGVVSIEDDAYPRLLKETADPPVFLSYRGDLSTLDHPCVAVVGTREMSDYGRRVTEWLVPPLIRAECTVVSGLAYGIDAVAAQCAIDRGGRTVAVLGSGFGQLYPKQHDRLADAIVASGGLLLSEYPYDELPNQHAFPERNRVVAGLALATVVVEAPERSGSLITARLALEENRDVFACPGPLFDPKSEGVHRLIAEGQAQLLRSPDDVLRTIGVVAPSSATRKHFAPSSPGEASVYAHLTSMPIAMDDLVARTGKTAGELAAALTMLELAGAAAKAGGGWVRS